MLDKECNFAPCISQIDEGAPWESQFAFFFKLWYGILLQDDIQNS